MVTIRSGGGVVGGDFQLQPLPEVQVPVDQLTQAFDLDDFVLAGAATPIETISWDSIILGARRSGATILDGNIVSIFGINAGQDTLIFTARDTLGNVQTTAAIVRVVGLNEVLKIRPIPDISFIAGQPFNGIDLNSHIADREVHPDSLVLWTVEDLNPEKGFIVQVRDDSTVFALGLTTGETEVVFAASDTALSVIGRDTVRVIARDPADAALQLKNFPPLVIVAGQVDSSIVLNDFLPDGIDPAEVLWLVSGQVLTLPEIALEPPHKLLVSSVGTSVGLDSLRFTADLGAGFFATGAMEVLVTESLDATTLDIQAIPNPFNSIFVDLWVIARKALASTPTVVRNFAGVDSTVSMRQIEGDLQANKVLAWTGSVQLPLGAEGEVFFTTQAQTVLGSTVRDTVSVTISTAGAGKRVALVHHETELHLPADAVAQGTLVILQTEQERAEAVAAKVGVGNGELQVLTLIDVHPVGLALRRSGRLHWRGVSAARDGIYRRSEGTWHFIGPAGEAVSIERLGQFALLRDAVAPQVEIVALPREDRAAFTAAFVDGGSGIDPASVRLLVDGREEMGHWEAHRLHWDAGALAPGFHTLQVQVEDRAGNETVRQVQFAKISPALPLAVELGANYPNPFNPETIIPFSLSVDARVRLVVYNATGQLVRQLLDEVRGRGRYEIRWNGRNEAGEQVGSGVYLYRLQTGAVVKTKSLMLLK